MHAIALTDAGVPPTAIELDRPAPAADEVLVRVTASSVNGFDVAVAAGMLQGMMEHRFPVVLGKDVAGTVVAIGDAVHDFSPGDAVFGVVTKPFLGDGSFGEFVTMTAAIGLARLPDGLDPATMGALGLAGTAAADTVDTVAASSDHTVLVVGATGGVGSLAVQLLAASGATVIATARRGEGADLVTRLGASHVVDHSGDLAAHVRALAPQGVDAVAHLAGAADELLPLVRDGGRLVSTLGVGSDQHPAAVAVMSTPLPATLDRLSGLVAAGRLEVPIARTYPLDQVPQALDDFSRGTLGKLAVAVA